MNDLYLLYTKVMNRSKGYIVEDQWRELLNAYSDPSRHYHNIDHLYEFTGALSKLNIEPLKARWYYQAAFYHDAVYVPGASNNEVESLRLWFRHSGAVEPEEGAAVSALILSTKDHKSFGFPEYAQEFIDIDMAPFDYPSIAYDHYVRAIRKEYSQYSEESWIAGRSQFLSRLLESGQIFKTKPNDRARENISRELKVMGSILSE